MKAGAPWSIKGIEPEAREAAKRAAARAGMTLGEWFNHVLTTADPDMAIRQTADASDAPESGPPHDGAPAMAAEEADALRAEIAALSNTVRTLAERLDAAEDSAATHVEALTARIEEAEMASPPASGGDEGAMEALRALAEKVDGIDKVRREATTELQAALRDLARHTEEVRSSSEASIGDTRASLDALSQRIERSFEKSNEAVTTVGKAIEMMASRLSRLEQRMQAEGATFAASGDDRAQDGKPSLAGATGAAGVVAAAMAASAAADTEAAETDGPTGSDRDDWLPEAEASDTDGTSLTGPEAARWLNEDTEAGTAPAAEPVTADAAPETGASGDWTTGWDSDGFETITRTGETDPADLVEASAAEAVAGAPDDVAAADDGWPTAAAMNAPEGSDDMDAAAEPQRTAAERWTPGSDAVTGDIEEAAFDVDAYLDAHLGHDGAAAGHAPDTQSAGMGRVHAAMPETPAETAEETGDEPAAFVPSPSLPAGEVVAAERQAAPAPSTSTIDAFLGQFSDEDGIVLPREEEPYGMSFADREDDAAEPQAETGQDPLAALREESAADTEEAGWTREDREVPPPPLAAAAAALDEADEDMAPETAGGRRPEDVIAAIRKAARGDDFGEDLAAERDGDPVEALFDDEDEDEDADEAAVATGGDGSRKLRIGLVAASIVVLLAGGSYLVL
ncbi:hypothetical protein [Futiania mangrovi]|uniref:Uncharacterized protein n=1 Tax=Futiania mangrovi TaxID=2959716 RepID=A0A9J6PHZ3_9PROT|nr:hypothetical protein [Futiania mangrovii]MCP1336191.1 hypothetical protein [Futiania mangrovii]